MCFLNLTCIIDIYEFKSTIFDHDENTNKEIQVIDVSPKNNEIIKKISFLNYIVVFIISFAYMIYTI